MRSIDERQGLLKDHWKERLNLKEYSLSKYQQMVSETPILDGESKQDAQRRELFYINMLSFMTTFT